MSEINEKIRNHPGFLAFRAATSPVRDTEIARKTEIDSKEKHEDMSYANKNGGDAE